MNLWDRWCIYVGRMSEAEAEAFKEAWGRIVGVGAVIVACIVAALTT